MKKKKPPCSKTTYEKGKGEGGNHTNEISILKFSISEIEENHAREHV